MVTARVVPFGGAIAGGARLGRTSSAARRGWLVEVRDAQGRIGRGEASPLPGYSRDTFDEAGAALRQWTPPHAVDDAGIVAAGAAIGPPSARFAVETALFDLAAARDGVSLHVRVGAARPSRAIPINILLPDLDPTSSAAFVTAAAARGVRAVKRKLGADLDHELAIVAAVRRSAPSVALRLDANGLVPPAEAPAFCAALAAHGVACIEEPVAGAALYGLERLALPVALDESLQSADAEAVIDRVASRHALAAVVLKPTALGGLSRCRALAAHAARYGARAIVTHTFDGPVAMAAAAELALALPDVAVAGLAPHAALAAYPAWRGAALGDVAVTPHDRPGLGLAGASP